MLQLRTYAEPLHVGWAVPTRQIAVAFKSAICVSSELVQVAAIALAWTRDWDA